MARYIALLRGINVGGINIKMADLKDAISSLGFDNVKTVLASGNVLFDSDRTDREAIKASRSASRRRCITGAWETLRPAMAGGTEVGG